MVAAHVLDGRSPDGTLTRTSWVVDGRASALFAVLAGVSLVLMHRRTSRAGLAVRALLVALLGLALGELETGLAIILTYYGLLFLMGLPFLGLRARALFLWAAAWVVIGPVVSHLVRPHLAPRSGPSPAFDQLANPGHLLAELLLTGYYPCLPWLAYLLLGMAIGRCDLRSRSVQARLVVGGLGVAVVAFVVSRSLTEQPWVLRRLVPDAAGYGDVSTADAFVNAISGGMHGTTPAGGSWAWLLVVAPHSGTPFDLLQTGATAALVIGLCVWLVAWLDGAVPPRGGDPVRRRDDDAVALQPARGHAHRAGLARRGAGVVRVARPRAARGRARCSSRPGGAGRSRPRWARSAPASPLDGRAGVHHHRDPGRRRPVERVRVDDAELEPHGPCAHLDRLVGELAGGRPSGGRRRPRRSGTARRRGWRRPCSPSTTQTVRPVGRRVDRDDLLAALLEQRGDGVRRPARCRPRAPPPPRPCSRRA